MPPKPNKNHLPAVTRVVIMGGAFVDNIPATRCKPDEQLAIVVVNVDNTEYQLKMTGFKNKGANAPVNDTDLFKAVTKSHQITPVDATAIQRTVKGAANWGTGVGQFPYTTYECTFELWNKLGTAKLDSIDPDYDITP